MLENTVQGFQRLHGAVHHALRTRNKLHIEQLAPFGQLQLLREQGFHRPDVEPAKKRLLINELLLDCIQQLESSQQIEAAVLHQRFIIGDIIVKAANLLNISEDQLNRTQRQAVKDLTWLLLGREEALRARNSTDVLAALPPADLGAFEDVFGQLARLREWALAQGPPYVMGVVGLGGLGKTRLVNALAQELASGFHYDWVFWVAAAGSDAAPTLLASLAERLLPAAQDSLDWIEHQLRRHFRLHRYLVVVDAAGSPGPDPRLLEAMAALAGPSKFVFTSRRQPGAAPGFRLLTLGEWPQAAAQRAMLAYANDLGLGATAVDLEAAITVVHETVGGHPVALRTALDLLSALPLDDVRRAFLGPGDEHIAALYRNVYGDLWPALSEGARQLLSLLAASDGLQFSQDQTLAPGQLVTGAAHAAVKELIRACLLERGGSLAVPRYRLAGLTRAWLRSGYPDLL